MGDIPLSLEEIKDIYENHLLKSDLSVITDKFIADLNQTAYDVMYRVTMDTRISTEYTKYILMICNLLYNRTDMNKLPIDDGFYDLILETHKKFDPNFQVGAAVVEFQSAHENVYGKPNVIQGIHFYKDERPDNEINKFIRGNIMREGQPLLTKEDFIKGGIVYHQAISKRTHNTVHEHPDLVGTLDKAKFVLIVDALNAGVLDDPTVVILERDFFGKHIKEGIIHPDQELEMVLELKYDGISVEADCTNVVESARTRGDTGIGVAADITPILKDYPLTHARCRIGQEPLGVKFEAIMTKTDLRRFCEARGKDYVNARTAIIGLFGASDACLYRDYITLVPLAVDRDQLPQIPNRMVEIEFINKVFQTHGEPLRYMYIKGTVTECLFYIKKFVEEAEGARPYLNFMYDGIVVSYLDEGIRKKLGRKNFINKYSMAVKFDPAKKLTYFRGYTFEVGQDGRITPMIHYDPVEFIGTIHNKSSGYSFKRFKELQLHYGDMLEVTYRNDVMPYVTKPDNEHNRVNAEKTSLFDPPTHCPVCGTELIETDSGKSLMCSNYDCKGRRVSRMVNMLAKMNLKGFAESAILSIDKYTLTELLNLDENYLLPRLGNADTRTFLEAMDHLKMDNLPDYILIGSLGFSGCAVKTWQAILNMYSLPELMNVYENAGGPGLAANLSLVNGVGPTTANIIAREFPMFWDDLATVAGMENILTTKGSGEKLQIRFTGCRNKQLEELLCKSGYDADGNGSVTQKTDILIVPYDGFSSSKTSKMKKGIVVSIQEFQDHMEEILSCAQSGEPYHTKA